MSAATASIVSCASCDQTFVFVTPAGRVAARHMGRTVAELKGWQVAKDGQGLASSAKDAKDWCADCVAAGRAGR